MSAVTPIGGEEERKFYDAYDDLEAALQDINIAAELIAAADGHMDVEAMNRAGFMVDRLARRARGFLKELWELQRRPA